jgi:hypothetical protein
MSLVMRAYMELLMGKFLLVIKVYLIILILIILVGLVFI